MGRARKTGRTRPKRAPGSYRSLLPKMVPVFLYRCLENRAVFDPDSGGDESDNDGTGGTGVNLQKRDEMDHGRTSQNIGSRSGHYPDL
jgi:hypothetical protein